MDYTTLWAYLWDLLDEGIDLALGRMREDAGVDTVSIAAVYHSVQHLRPHASGSKFFAAQEAALYFQPDKARYRSSYLQPRVSPLVIGGDPLREVSQRCEALGMRLIAWVVTLHNSHLGTHYPDVAVRNVFGDPIREALCPAHESVRAYVRTLIEDLDSNYHLDGIELESLAYPCARHYHSHARIGISLGPVERFLLCLCFCPACRRHLSAVVDVDAAAAAARAKLEDVFARGESTTEPLADYLANHPAVTAYVTARAAIVTSFVEEIKSAARSEIIYMAPDEAEACGADLAAIGRVAGRLEKLCYYREPQVSQTVLRQLARLSGDARRVAAGFCCYAPLSPDPETLCAQVRAAADVGVGALSFYNYGIMPRRNLPWIKQALAACR